MSDYPIKRQTAEFSDDPNSEYQLVERYCDAMQVAWNATSLIRSAPRNGPDFMKWWMLLDSSLKKAQHVFDQLHGLNEEDGSKRVQATVRQVDDNKQ